MRWFPVTKYAKKMIWFLLVLAVLPHAKAKQADSVQIRSFTAGLYKASTFNYTGFENGDGTLYFANENGVLEYDGSRWRLIPIHNFSAVTAIARIKGKIYVGGRDEFGYLQANNNGAYSYKSLRHLLKLKKGELLKDIWQIVGVGDDVYFGSLEMLLRFDGKSLHVIPHKGAYIFNLNNELHTHAFKKGLAKVKQDSVVYLNTDFKFPNDAAFQYVKGLKGENFLVTADHGIFLLDTLSYQIKSWEAEANKVFPKSSLYCMSVWQDSLYAVSTYNDGLFVLNSKGKIVQTYHKGNGLIGNELRESFVDRRGGLWLTSNYGLYYLQAAAGVPGPDENYLQTKIRFVDIGEQEVSVMEGLSSLAIPEDYSGSVVFHFATPGFHADELEYSYYLEGYEDHWSAWKPEIKKEYTNLRGGDYKFYVKARLKDKKESLAASLMLGIPTPWYKTKWAYFIAISFIAAAIVLVVQYRTKKLKLLNKRLSKIIGKRTMELVEQREQLKVTNSELRVRNTELDNFVYRSSHDLVAPLKSLKGLIHITQQEKDEAIRAHYFKLMNTSIEKLEDFIKSIMEYSSNAKKDVVQVEINLNEIIESIVEDLKYYDRAEKIELIRNLDPKASFYSDPRRLKIILSNLITNSIKYHNYYQDYLFIEVRSQQLEGYIRIDVIDNGKGIDANYVNKVFDMFFRASDSAQGSGLGLYIVKDTAEKLGGTISVSSELGKGTTFSLMLPSIILPEALVLDKKQEAQAATELP